jgi:hypothetical protein
MSSRSRASYPRRRASRRGGIYVAVLGVAMVVTLIGLSALLAVRVDQRATDLMENAVKVDFQAQATVDRALLRLNSIANWRTTYTNDTWTAGQTFDGVTTSFKLVDELDGNLANDANQPVRVYGRAVAGDALRMYSVCVQPRSTPNLLANADMEAGTASWSASNCQIEARTDDYHGGTKSVYAKNRVYSSSGPKQILVAPIENGVPYRFEGWVRVDLFMSSVRLVIETTGSNSGTQSFSSGTALAGMIWTRVAGTITPSWSGALQSAAVYVTTALGTTAFKIDDAALVNADPTRALVPAPGTWRREVLP